MTLPLPPFAAALLHRLGPERRLMLVQFLRFGMVGTLGFVWDTSVVYATTPFVGPYFAGLISYFVASSINWLLNRLWTYGNAVHAAPHKQLLLFLIANSVGLAVNRGVYFTLIFTQPFFRAHLVLPIISGGLCGMFFNFFLSRRLVFR